MNDRDQQVERKLASLRPTKPSAELIDRIAQRALDQQPVVVANKRSSPRQTFPIWTVFTGLAAAFLVALTMWFSFPSGESSVAESELAAERHPEMVPSQNDNAVPPELFGLARREMDAALPSVGNYLSAMRESPELFDMLLQKHADNLMHPTSSLTVNDLIKENPS